MSALAFTPFNINPAAVETAANTANFAILAFKIISSYLNELFSIIILYFTIY
ncbi:hypothetical protein FD34_GL000966 [Limosilactobacillus pontis DSM 8475]|uniref:Uncharacterized protein n=1 Tax=Limosilactobacillus pontis DSM 8475 TaxID=1423794 RepID=A0A922TK31_9LACO|nr:hypothetical protein FD34_GL000966 [Limosilactobacillus pontis DSM 8475]